MYTVFSYTERANKINDGLYNKKLGTQAHTCMHTPTRTYTQAHAHRQTDTQTHT